MSSMHEAEQRGASASYKPDLVVAVEHTREVVREVGELGVPVGEVDPSPALGLSLVPLPDEAASAAALPAPPGMTSPSNLDRLLHGLRTRFADRYAGWVPTIGKNRLLGGVIGGGKISYGGVLGPVLDHQQLPARTDQPGRGVRVGVLDTAIAEHPWLAGGWVAAPGDVLAPGETHSAVAGHATFIAGLVLQEAPGCVVVARQVLGDDGSADSWSVAQEIVEHGREGLDVLNLSLFCHTDDGEPPLVLARAIDRLPPETVVVAAAGNHGEGGKLADPRWPAWPAALDGVVAVGATDEAGEVASFSPKGVPWVDVLAPGTDRVSTYLDGTVSFDNDKTEEFTGLASWSGTSFAAASVSGVIAARTVPGRVSARRAWERLREESGRPAVLRLDGDRR
jgi:subtilisin family serine protease